MPALEDIGASMEEHRLKGLSVAVFDEYGSIATRSIGVRSATGRPITDTTAFSTASISKPVTALLCLTLAQKGLIDLDTPIASSLTRWQLPASDIAGSSGVTWRQLLTHTGGTSQHGFADYYQGDDIPTLIDSVEGRIARYDKPIEFLFPPGEGWQYSGGGYVILQMALEDRTGRRLEDLAQELIFTPLAMRHTTMIQPGQPGFPDDVALVHDGNGTQIRDGLPITPQISASGMWSTPGDLSAFAIAIQRGLRGETVGPVTPAIARAMTDIFSLKYVGGMGMPFFRGFGLGNTDWFRHDGSNTGVNSDLFASMEGGYGFVLMGNGDDDNTGPVFAEARRKIIDAMGWARRHPIADRPLSPAHEAAMVGSYKGLLYDLGLDYTIERRGGQLVIVSEFFSQFLGRDSSPIHHLGDDVFRIEDYPNLLHFEFDPAGRLTGITLTRPGSDAEPFRRPIDEMR
ncbi:hypothetical protein BA950_09640 [Erythrobacter sp. SAORIC-644]|uniref:serine hydrolase domain-containing protein n=1 Tax=Erythrobacter sp. SAORIC-644 TaxID=1869314 RepID=UPI000C9EDACA|nr:serine hydrolase domain-containing protein [Erythrobacter sp. SAORIC-644]PNQ76063.1 hypothetical protein BA950_09640 [Erythrobacter sp. SAORIC-644]